MRRVLLILVCVLSFSSLEAKDRKPLRGDLEEQQRISAYSLVSTWGGQGRGGEVYIVSVQQRTVTTAKAKDLEGVTSSDCWSRDRRYVIFHKNGIWLRDNVSSTTEEIESDGDFSTQCFSPDLKAVFFAEGKIRIYDVKAKKVTDIAESPDRTWPTWSPNGKWLGFDEGNRYTILDTETGRRRKLFKYSSGVYWSPDSRYLTYTKLGGSMGGFLFWGIKCIEPYRVWVWRVEDGAHDWVLGICKPGYSFQWVENSALSDR